MVPQPHDIDISKYMENPSEQEVCATPSVQNRRMKKPLSVQRKRNLVILNLDKISMTLSDDEDSGISPPPPVHSTRKPRLRTNLIKRKLLEDDLMDSTNSNKEDAAPIETELTNLRTKDKNNTHIVKRSVKDNIVKVMPSMADVLENLDLPGKSDVATENMDKLIENMENFKIDTNRTFRKNKARDTRKLAINCNENVDEAMEPLESMTINENTSTSSDSLTLMGEVNRLSVQDQKNSEIRDKRKLIKTSKTSKQSAENESATSTSGVLRNKHTKPLTNEVHGVRTRYNTKKLKEKLS